MDLVISLRSHESDAVISGQVPRCLVCISSPGVLSEGESMVGLLTQIADSPGWMAESYLLVVPPTGHLCAIDSG